VAVEQDNIESGLRRFESLCRERGLPLTVQRREILKALLQRNDHPTADQVYETVKERVPGLSRTTVYRVLETLVELGVARRLHHPGANARFDGNTSRHHHLVCRICNQVIDFESPSLDRLKLPSSGQHGFRIEDYSVHVVGVCGQCHQKASQ